MQVEPELVIQPQLNEEEFPPYQPTFGEKVLFNLIGGIAKGFLWYGMDKGMAWLSGERPATSFSLSSYVFVQFSAAACVQTAKITHLLVLNVLGEREVYENLAQTESCTDFFRKHTWSLVSSVERLEQKTDALFSYVLGISTMKEIEEGAIEDKDLYFFEIFRREVIAQAKETIPEVISLSLALPLATRIGFHIATGNAIIWLNVYGFLFSLTSRVSEVYTKIDAENNPETVDN